VRAASAMASAPGICGRLLGVGLGAGAGAVTGASVITSARAGGPRDR
jgi:hypothetical protein